MPNKRVEGEIEQIATQKLEENKEVLDSLADYDAGKKEISTERVERVLESEPTGDWEEEFDEEFVKDNGNNTEPSFKDPNGDVGPVKSFIRTLLSSERSRVWKQQEEKWSNCMITVQTANELETRRRIDEALQKRDKELVEAVEGLRNKTSPGTKSWRMWQRGFDAAIDEVLKIIRGEK